MARLLVVEDEPTVRELVVTRLRNAGHRVVAAESAADALDVVALRGAPEVAVLDVGLPDGDGYGLLERLRAAQPGAAFGVVFLSAGVDEALIRRGRALGGIYLTKPFVASALLSAVESALPTAVGGDW